MIPWTFSVFDIEAEDWNRFRCGSVLTSQGEVESYTSVEALRAHLERLGSQTPVFAHYGGIYDFLFLMPLQSVTLSGAPVAHCQVGQTWLHDSARLFDQGLAKVGKAVGLEKWEGKAERIAEMTDAEVTTYCERDCEILVRALEQHRKDVAGLDHPSPRWPHTAGSTALYLQEALEPDHVDHLARHPLDPATWMLMHEAIQGNRTELWTWGVQEDVCIYDINSAFAQAWRAGPLPVPPWRFVRREVRAPAVYWCDVIRQDRSRLPVVAPGGRWQYDGAGWLTSEEMAVIRELGGDVHVEHGWAASGSLPLGHATMEHLYPLKQAGRPWAKSAIVSLHGKYSQGLQWETYYHQPSGYVVDRELRLPSWSNQPLVAAFVYGRARILLARMLHLLRARGWRVYYTDTDSVHTDCPPHLFPGVIGLGCGEWKVEAAHVEVCYVAPKVYAYRTDGGLLKRVCSGVHKALEWGQFVAASQGERVEVKERGGLRTFRSMMGRFWRPEVHTATRSVVRSTGGKRVQQGKVQEEGPAGPGSHLYPDGPGA